MIMLYSVSEPIKSHVYCSGYILSSMMFDAVLYVATIFGGCGWPISARAVLMDVAFWQFSNNTPISDPMANVMTFIIILHYTCTGTFYGGIACISVLDFGPRKNTHLLCFMPLVLICSMHSHICGESVCFFCILLLHMDVSRCNFKIQLFFWRF